MKLLARGITGRTALFILSLIVIVHLSIFYFYLQTNSAALRSAKSYELLQKVINTIHLVEATPALNRAHAVDALDDPDLRTTFTIKPRWRQQFRNVFFWEISQAINKHPHNFAVSICLGKHQWLNLNANIYSDAIYYQFLLILLEVFVFGTLLLSAWSISRYTRPLENFTEAAERLGIDLHSQPVAISGPSVVKKAAHAMNKMQERIKDLIRDRTQMLAAISHDLRTPITRMKLRTQFVKDNNLISKFTSDLDEMESMIAQTLSFARDDAANEERAHLDLVSLLTTLADDMKTMGHNVSFQTKLKRCHLNVRPIALKRAFTNLINNAVRYASNVDIKLIHRHKTALIKIEDDGPGIPEHDLEKVFAPFYRGEASRSRDTGGVGLGLAVTRDIIRAHNGHITLSNRRQGGLRVVIELNQ